MWQSIQAQLENHLLARHYRDLEADPAYRGLYSNARIALGPAFNFDKLSAQERARLQEQVKLMAPLVIRDLQHKTPFAMAAMRFELLRGVRLYRVKSRVRGGSDEGLWANHSTARSSYGSWWFSEGVWRTCQTNAHTNEAKIEWLRQNLAISYDWNSIHEIVALRTDLAGLPAIQGRGLPQFKLSSPGALAHAVEGIAVDHRILNGLPGGAEQTFLPFVPRTQIRSVHRFF